MEAPETQGKRTVFMILVSSCVFFSAVKVIRLVRFQGRQGGFMSSKAQTREKDYEIGLRIADRRRTMRLSQDELAHRAGIGRLDCQHFFRQIFLGYFSDIVQAFDTLRKNVCGDDYTSLHNPIVLSSVLPAYGMFHSIQILFL